jgi:glyoxylase-like metal-dependent hydrolase (beta-lactamase superfamily II)
MSVHALAIPTPFAVGDVNAYLLEGEPLTLIDNGPNSATALLALERALAALGYAVRDLELLLITHHHVDHFGLTEALVDRSGARVACLDRLAPYLTDFAAAAAEDDDFAAGLMLAHGVDERTVRTIRQHARVLRGWGAAVPIDLLLRDGDTVEAGGRLLRVLHRPGHSATDTIFVDERRATAIAGDHLLPQKPATALIAPVPGTPAGFGASDRPRALQTHLASMRATRDLGLERILPGHGTKVDDPAALIGQHFAVHEQRSERLLSLLDHQPRSAHELATLLWGDAASAHAYVLICEVLGRLDLLLDAGLVDEISDGQITRFSRR